MITIGSYVINKNNILSIVQPLSGGKETVNFSGCIGCVIDYDSFHCLVRYRNNEVWETARELVEVLSEEEYEE